jgi:hypothetical protein
MSSAGLCQPFLGEGARTVHEARLSAEQERPFTQPEAI